MTFAHFGSALEPFLDWLFVDSDPDRLLSSEQDIEKVLHRSSAKPLEGRSLPGADLLEQEVSVPLNQKVESCCAFPPPRGHSLNNSLNPG
jgi:hypothetical protein